MQRYAYFRWSILTDSLHEETTHEEIGTRCCNGDCDKKKKRSMIMIKMMSST